MASTTSRPGKRLRAKSHANPPPATNAIKVAALATANESFIGNQSISLPFMTFAQISLAFLQDCDGTQRAAASPFDLHRQSDDDKVLDGKFVQVRKIFKCGNIPVEQCAM